MNEFPLVGRLVRLRPIRESDIKDYERWGSDPGLEAWKYDGPWYPGGDPAEFVARALQRLRDPKDPPSRVEIETTEGVHIGNLVVRHDPRDPHMTDVGITIYEDRYWNRGLGTEALRLWIDYLFRTRGYTRIGLGTWSGNIGMIRVSEKLGMKQEGCLRDGCEVGGRFHDRLRFGILRREWPGLA